MRTRLTKVIVIVSLLAVSAVAGLELWWRAFPESRPSFAQVHIDAIYGRAGHVASRTVPDDQLGFRGKPGYREVIANIDYTYTAENDANGFPNRDPWPERAAIVFLGDSLLVGRGVGFEGQFTTLVAEALPGRPVVNLALPGASPLHMLRIFRRFGAPLHPQLVVACLYVASDVDNAKHFDAWRKAGQQWSYGEFRLKHYPETLAKIVSGTDARTSGASAAGRRETGGLKAHMRAFVYATAVGAELLYLLEPWRKGFLHKVTWPDGSRVFLHRPFQKRLLQGLGNEYPSISEVFFGPLVDLRAAVESTGGTFLVVLIPSKEEIVRAAGADGMLRLVTEVRQGLDALSMPVLDAYPAIANAARTTAPFYAYDTHLNAVGNAAMADLIVDWIRRNRVAPGP